MKIVKLVRKIVKSRLDVGTVGNVEKFCMSSGTGLTKIEKSWNSWKSREEHREGLTEFMRRDGLSNVEKGLFAQHQQMVFSSSAS